VAARVRAQSDSALQRVLWSALERLGRRRPRAARAVAAVVMRAAARTGRGYAKGLFRVARRRPVPMPGLYLLPEAWWTTAPRVRARRLGVDLELDLRDNLQRTLFFTGTYEPGLVRVLRRELRAGDSGPGSADSQLTTSRPAEDRPVSDAPVAEQEPRTGFGLARLRVNPQVQSTPGPAPSAPPGPGSAPAPASTAPAKPAVPAGQHRLDSEASQDGRPR